MQRVMEMQYVRKTSVAETRLPFPVQALQLPIGTSLPYDVPTLGKCEILLLTIFTGTAPY